MKKRESKRTPTGKGKRRYKGAPKSGAKAAVRSAIKSAKKPARTQERAYTGLQKLILSSLKSVPEGKISSRPLFKMTGTKDKKYFYDALHQLERAGEIKVVDHIVTYQASEGDVVAQMISLSAGFGFARPEDGGRGDDVFVHGSDLKGAFVGDMVILTDVRQEDRGAKGRVKRITERSSAAQTGTIHLDNYGHATVTPDGGLRYDLKINLKDLAGARDRDKVAFRPLQDRFGEWRWAKVLTVFGSGDSARVNADAIIERSGIPFVFSREVLDEAEKMSAQPITDEEIARRTDFRDKPIFTIDGKDAKDLDDAILVERTAAGYTLGVHIADVSHYVTEKSKVDEEALLRGTSVYFADRVIPMLPEALSNDVCSLNAGTDKLAFSALIDFDKNGEIVAWDFKKSIICSKVRGVYTEVNDIFAGTASDEIMAKYQPVLEGLSAARELADILKERAESRGEMELHSSEVKFVLDENGVCIDLAQRETGEAEQLIEQMMISANIAAAKFGQEHKLPFLFRTHGKPQLEKVSDLVKLLDTLGVDSSALKKGEPETGDFAKILEAVKGEKCEGLVSMSVLRTMEKARYTTEETGHFGLSLHDYSHFTSPIRRYPDTSIHRIMSAYLSGMPQEKLEKRFGEFAKTSAVSSSKNEVRAVNAERDAESCYIAEYMKAHVGETYTGVISGALPKGFFVRIPNGAEGYVALTDFENASYEYDGIVSYIDRHTAKKLIIGDEIEIKVAKADVASGKVDFVPVNG